MCNDLQKGENSSVCAYITGINVEFLDYEE